MNPVALHRTPLTTADVDRSAARIVHTARHVEHGPDVAAIARARPAGAKVATLAGVADGAGRGPVAFLRRGQHDAAVGRHAETVGVAQASGEHLERTARDPAQTLVAGCEIPASAI